MPPLWLRILYTMVRSVYILLITLWSNPPLTIFVWQRIPLTRTYGAEHSSSSSEELFNTWTQLLPFQQTLRLQWRWWILTNNVNCDKSRKDMNENEWLTKQDAYFAFQSVKCAIEWQLQWFPPPLAPIEERLQPLFLCFLTENLVAWRVCYNHDGG